MRKTAYALVAGGLAGMSAWLTCAAVGVTVANPVFSFGMLGLSLAVLYRLQGPRGDGT